MKKLILFITCLLIATSTLWAADFFKLNGLMYCYTSGGVAVTFTIQNPMYKDYNHAQDLSGNLTIPSSVTYNGTTYSVIGIGRHAFDGCHYLTSVTIPNSVTYIEEYAFYGCYGLTSVTIGASVTSIGDYAFSYCTGLTEINVNSDNPNYKSIDGILYNKNVTQLIRYPAKKNGSFAIPNSVTSIRYDAFYGCTGLTSVTIPNSVTSIGSGAFEDCSGLTGTLTIPNSVTSIGYNAFYNCSGLTSVTIPNSVTRIGYNAFKDCTRLTTVNFNAENCTKMGEYALPVFYGCSNLKTINIGENVKTIPYYAFCKCTGLTSITIPNSVTSIGTQSFWGCTGLTSITIPYSVTHIGDGAFSHCTGLTGTLTIPNSVTSALRASAFKRCSGLTSVIISNSITEIHSDAFYECSGLTSIVIGNGTTQIGDETFHGCDNLITVVCLANTPPNAYGNSFSNYNAVLYVPDESISQYKYHQVWKNFKNIFPLSEAPAYIKDMIKTAAIAEANGNNAQIFGSEKRIVINNAANATVAIYDVMGKTVVKEQRINTNNAVFAMPQRGMYIVRMGKAAKKVWVK